MFARSLAYDGDVDFTNDYALCGDPFDIGWITPAHRPANFFYFGPALLWTPLVWVLKHFVHGAPNVAGGCVGPIPAIVLVMSSFVGGVTVLVTSAMLRRITTPRLAALTTLVATLGGLLLYYTAMSASYSHAYDAMFVALYLWMLVRIREDGARRWRVAAAGILLGLAILQRSSNAIFFWVAPLAFMRTLSLREALRVATPVSILGLLGFAFGIVPTAWINHAVYGRFSLYAHGPHFLHPGHAHPLLLIFDQRGGLFAWAPIFWLAVPGVVLLARRRDVRWLVVPLIVCGAFELFLSSAALDWQGARRLTNLTPLFALAMAPVFEKVARFVSASPGRLKTALGAAFVAALAWGNGSVCGGFANKRIPWDQPLTTSQRWAEGQAAVLTSVERVVGPLTALPAAWIFSARYHLSPLAFGWAAHPMWYARDMRTLEYQAHGFAFGAREAHGLMRGLRSEPERACMTARDAAIVFSAQWPFASRARLVYDAEDADTLSIASRSFSGASTPWATRVALVPGKTRKLFVDIPAGAFDSGINEVSFVHDGAPDKLCLRSLEFVDDTRYPPAFEALASPPIHAWHAIQMIDGDAISPSVAIGGAGAWTMEAHERPLGAITGSVGRRGELGSPASMDATGFHPRLAVSGDDVVEVWQSHLGVSEVFARVGAVSAGADSPRVAWGRPMTFANGYHASVAAFGRRVVEMHARDAVPSELAFRTGARTRDAIAWSSESVAGVGFEPSVALSSTWVVVAAQRFDKAGPLELRTGKLDASGAIAWSAPSEYDRGVAPSVALFGDEIVEVHQEQDDAGHMWLSVGTIVGDGVVRWTYRRQYDEGARPAVALDATRGIGVEVHQGELGPSALWSHDLELY